MGTYEKGDSDEDEIGRLQTALGVEADGEFGAETLAAVKAWQKANGAKADGMAGPDMLLALGLDDLVVVEKGDEGELVRGLQSALGVEADGEFGASTDKALRAWQKQNGQKATGKALLATLQALGISGDAAPAPAEAPQHAPVATRPSAPAPRPAEPPKVSPRAAASATDAVPAKVTIGAWAYQLADIDPATIAQLPVDLCVIDYSADGEDATAFKPADTAAMKMRPDGGRKLLI